MGQIKLYDTTLRDGMQGPGMSLSAHEKLQVAHLLDSLGIDYIEAGFPGSNPKDIEMFRLLEENPPAQAELVAFGMTRRKGVAVEDDPGLKALLSVTAPVVTLVGKTWRLHLDKVTRVSPEENLTMISESISWCRQAGKRVFYDAEHFFDAYREHPDYALECVRVAAYAGAENVTLCDTNGSSLPVEIAEAVAAVGAAFSAPSNDRYRRARLAEIGVHTHNDAECAVANALVGIDAGATLVQGTINGYGERCGNANLTSIIPALQLKMSCPVVSAEQLHSLSSVAHAIAELCNLTAPASQPYVGREAFAHKGGLHIAGLASDPRTFEHLDPELIGSHRQILPSELSGRAVIVDQAAQKGLNLGLSGAERALEDLKALEHQGYQYEAAEASFELFLRRQSGAYQPLFQLESFRVITDHRPGEAVKTEATIKVLIDGRRKLQTAEGNGPVNALDNALRAVISDHHPELAAIELTNYKVRIIDEAHGTEAVTRVLLEASDGENEWTSIGVSENIIEASWQALVDSLEYRFQPKPDTVAPEQSHELGKS